MGKRRIIRGPPGERLDHFIERFIECSGKDRNSTYLVLPTSRAVKYVQERLHERGIPYIKNAIGTLSALSENMFNMTNSDRILLDNDQRAVIIDHIIETVKDGTPMIGKMSVTSGVSYNLATFFSLIYSYGEDYPACLKEGSAKSMELELLMGKYREYLEMNSLLDREMMIRSVIDQDEPIGTVLVYGLFEPMPIEKDLLVSLKERSMNMECYVPYIDNRKLFSDDWSWIGIDEVEDVPGSRFENIFNMESGKTSSVDLKIGKIRDRVCEIRNVSSEIRSILEEREDERIAVVLPEPDNGRRLISEIFGDYGIPFYMSRGAPLSESPLIQDLVNILRVVSFDFKRKDVVDLLGSPYLKFSYRGRRISGHEVDNISAGANVIGGRSGWKNSLENRMKVLDFEMKNPDISEGLKRKHEMEMRKLEFTKDSLMDLFSIIDHFSRKAPVGEHVRNFRKVIGDLEFDFDAGSSSKQEASALGEFFSILGSLERNSTLVPPSRITPYRFLSFLCNLIARKTYRPVQTNHSTVQVVGLRELAGLDFDTIFIVGMAEGEIPRTRLAHPFLNEAEIGRMNVLKREDLLRQERYYFWTDLLAASKSIYLSCPETDDDKPLVPSHFMMQMMDGYEYEEWGDNQIRGFGLNDQLEDGSRIVNRDLSNLASEMDLPGMVSRINSEIYYRRLDSYSIHDGIIEDIDVLGSIREEFSEEKAFSPSSLERYANCPFEFLLRYVLYLDTRDEVDETLTPLEKGNLIHHILFRFYRERKEKKINERNSDEALSRIIEIAEEEIERFHFEGPAWDSFREMMFRKGDDPGFLQKFIESEEGFDLMGLEPRFFELSMGTRIDPANRDPASVDLPVEIDLGDGILKIKGKIDRVDVNDKGQFVVVDYKTGKLPTKKMLEEGRSLQLPLYLKALGSLDGDLAGVGGAYYQVKDTNNISMKYMLGRKNIKECGNDPGFQYEIESSMDHVKEYLKGIRNGRFHTTNEIRKECPSHCAGKDICRYVRTRPLEIRGDE